MSTTHQSKTPITGDQLYAQELAQTKASIGDDIQSITSNSYVSAHMTRR